MSNATNSRRERLKAKQRQDAERNKSKNFTVLDTSKLEDIEWVKLEPNEEYIFDIIPYEVTSKKHPNYDKIKKGGLMEDYALEIPVHRNMGPLKQSFVCPKAYGNRCEACEEHERILEEKREEYKADGRDPSKAYYDDEVKALRPSRRAFFIVRDVEDKGKMKIWHYPAAWSLDNLIKRANRKNVLLGDMIFEGISIMFTPEPNNFDKKAPGEITTFDFEKGESDYEYTEEDIAEAPKLDQMLMVSTAEEITNIMWGNQSVDEDASDDDDDVEEEVEKPARKRRQRDPEPEEVEDETEESPREARKRRRREREETTSPECPSGYIFGDDTDVYNECEGCSVYDSCNAEFEKRHPDE